MKCGLDTFALKDVLYLTMLTKHEVRYRRILQG